MNVKELSLIAFTILGQMSVGAFVLLGIVHFFAQRKAGIQEADRLSDRALLAIGPVLVLGFLASLFHLGSPLNAPRAISHVGVSPLSFEILAGLAFAVLGALFAFMQWRKLGSPTLRSTLAIVTALVGLVFVWAMTQVYLLPTVPAWDTPLTVISFFTTTLLLGAMALGAAYVANYAVLRRQKAGEDNTQLSLLRDALRTIALLAVIALGIHFIVIPLYVAYLATSGGAAAASAAIITEQNGLVFALRLLLLFVGAGLLSLFIYRNASSSGQLRILSLYAYLAFALVLIAEVLGRYLFYASMVRVGL
jgi:anaerobic dimethyl sulfoxide reductase subunit C (anchor subunit)